MACGRRFDIGNTTLTAREPPQAGTSRAIVSLSTLARGFYMIPGVLNAGLALRKFGAPDRCVTSK